MVRIPLVEKPGDDLVPACLAGWELIAFRFHLKQLSEEGVIDSLSQWVVSVGKSAITRVTYESRPNSERGYAEEGSKF